MEKSSYRLIETHSKRTIVYTNIYIVNKELVYNTDKESPPSVPIFGNKHHWAPKVSSINFNIKKEINLACYSSFFWVQNIGHCLFDMLYPVYVSMVRAGYENEDFNVITSSIDGKGSFGYKAIEKFSGRKIIESSETSEVYKIKKLVCGTLGVGNVVMGKNPIMYGQNEYGSMTLFKERMMKRMGVGYSSEKNNKCIIIDNKRYSEQEKNNIHKTIHKLNKNIDIKYIYWNKDFDSFEEQLFEIGKTDIHITSPGTGMMYMPFLKRGSININLGFMEHTQTNHARPNIKIENPKKQNYLFPSFMEQYVCCTADYVSTLYYNRFKYNNIEVVPLINLIKEALVLLKHKVVLKKNYYIDMEVFKEYCSRDASSDLLCNHLTDIAFFPEMFVNEHPKAINQEFVNIELLRSIKDELGYDRSYEVI